MNYNLNQQTDKAAQKISNLASLRKLIVIIGQERRNLAVAFSAIFLNAGLSLLGPYLIGYTIDTYIQTKAISWCAGICRNTAGALHNSFYS